MSNERQVQQAIAEASSVIAAQLEDLRTEVHKQRRAMEDIAKYLPGLVEALQNLHEIAPSINQLAEKLEQFR